MATLETLLKEVDKLNQDELKQLYEYIEHKRQTQWWVVPPENLGKIEEMMAAVQKEAESMSEDEINTVIDEAVS